MIALRRISEERGRAPGRGRAAPTPPLLSTADTLLDSQPPPRAGLEPANMQPYLGMTPDDWLRVPVRCQRHLPKRSLHLVASTLSQVHRAAVSDEHSAEERCLYMLLLLLAPRWLWPEPTKNANQPLEAYARPRLIQDRAELWSSGQHMTLLALAAARDTVPAPVAAPAAPLEPGTVNQALAARLLHMAKQGRHTTVWRQLYSHGLAPPGEATLAALQDKWLPTGPTTISLNHRSTPREAGLLCSRVTLRTAVRELGRGAAADVIGWHHENICALSSQEPFLLVLIELLQSYCTQDLGTVALDTINASLPLPLSKGSQAQGVRPLAIPTVFRKLIGKLVVHKWRKALADHSSPHQFAALRSNGCHLCAREARSLINRASSNVLVRCDIANAFNSIDREAVLQAFHDISPELAHSQCAWLQRPTVALTMMSDGTRSALRTAVGIPQKNPLSSLAFTAALGPSLRRLPTRSVTPLAFADDVLLICPRASALDDFAYWQRALGELGLTVSVGKTAVWDPRGDPEWAARFCAAYPGAVVSADGLTICGLPVAELSPDHLDWDMAWGNDPFLAQFLRTAQDRLTVRLRALSQFVHLMGPDTPAMHVALQILRTNLLPRFTHLFRFVPLRLTLPWARDLDRDLVTWLETLLHLPLREPSSTWILLTPASRGSLGFTPLVIDVLLHCLSGLLALSAAGEHPMTRDETADAQLARESLHELVGIDALACAAHLLPHRRPAFLRQVVQDGLQRRMLEVALWLTAPPPGPFGTALRRPSNTVSALPGSRLRARTCFLRLSCAMLWPHTCASLYVVWAHVVAIGATSIKDHAMRPWMYMGTTSMLVARVLVRLSMIASGMHGRTYCVAQVGMCLLNRLSLPLLAHIEQTW